MVYSLSMASALTVWLAIGVGSTYLMPTDGPTAAMPEKIPNINEWDLTKPDFFALR